MTTAPHLLAMRGGAYPAGRATPDTSAGQLGGESPHAAPARDLPVDRQISFSEKPHCWG